MISDGADPPRLRLHGRAGQVADGGRLAKMDDLLGPHPVSKPRVHDAVRIGDAEAC